MRAMLGVGFITRFGCVITAILTIPVIVMFCVWYVGTETPAYVWDYGGYWQIFQVYNGLIASGTPDWPSQIISAIWNSDYNPSAVIPLYPFYRLAGGGRTAYIIAIAVLYLLPAVIIATTVAARALKVTAAEWYVTFLVALTYLPFWAPTLRGMVDIIGLVFLGLATLLLFQSDFLKRKPLLSAAMLGVLIWAPFLFRRWYAYSIVAFCVSAYLVGIWMRLRQEPARVIASFTLAMGLSALVVLVLILCLQGGLANRALTTNYSDLYDSYQVSFLQHIDMLLGRLGIYTTTMILIGIIVSVIYVNVRVIFCTMAATLTFLLFTRTQEMAIHHFLPVAFWLFPSYVLGFRTLFDRLALFPTGYRSFAPAIIALIIFAFGVVPTLNGNGIVATIFLPKYNSHPLHLENYSEYTRLIGDIRTRLGTEEHFEVFSSSLVLSDSLLVSLEPSFQSRVIYAPHIAKVNFFPFDMMTADYAVAVTPPQTHQAPGSQQNITIPGQMLLDGKGFGSAFQRIGDAYNLAGGVKAYLFHRVRPVSIDEMGELLNELLVAYPDWRGRYQKSMEIPFAARQTKLGDIWGIANVVDSNTLFLHPGLNRATTVEIPFPSLTSARPRDLKVSIDKSMIQQCPSADGVILSAKLDNGILWTGNIRPGDSNRIPIPHVGHNLEIWVEKGATPDCDHVIAAFEFPD